MNIHIRHKDFLPLAEEILAGGSRLIFHAKGSSMSPFIRDGDAVTLAPSHNPVGVGDVILFRTAGERGVLHRVVRRLKGGVITRGDAAPSDDGFIPCGDILGKVVEVSGRGYNFHLRHPFKILIARRVLYPKNLSRYPLVLRLGRKIAAIAGN